MFCATATTTSAKMVNGVVEVVDQKHLEGHRFPSYRGQQNSLMRFILLPAGCDHGHKGRQWPCVSIAVAEAAWPSIQWGRAYSQTILGSALPPASSHPGNWPSVCGAKTTGYGPCLHSEDVRAARFGSHPNSRRWSLCLSWGLQQ